MHKNNIFSSTTGWAGVCGTQHTWLHPVEFRTNSRSARTLIKQDFRWVRPARSPCRKQARMSSTSDQSKTRCSSVHADQSEEKHQTFSLSSFRRRWRTLCRQWWPKFQQCLWTAQFLWLLPEDVWTTERGRHSERPAEKTETFVPEAKITGEPHKVPEYRLLLFARQTWVKGDDLEPATQHKPFSVNDCSEICISRILSTGPSAVQEKHK